MPALLTTLLLLQLLLLPALAPAQPLHELLALIEQYNPELQQQRRLLDATAAADMAGDDAGVLALLRQQEQSFWRHFRVVARAGARVSPGDEGTGIDTRAGLEFSLPLGDWSGELAIAKERQQQQQVRQSLAEKIEQHKLAYERQRAALRALVLAGLAELQAAKRDSPE